MSINFGYGGYGMGMNPMGMNMMGSNGMNQGGGIYQSISAQYSCPACYQTGPVPYSYKSNVNPLPHYVVQESWLSKLIRQIVGG